MTSVKQERRERKQTVRVSRIILSVAAIVVAATAVVLPVSAATTTTYGGGGVQGYNSDTELNTGTIVQLTGKDSNTVKVATQLDNMFGVVVDRNQVQLTFTTDGQKPQTYVTPSGTYNTLVSTQNGPIAIGDYVTLSAVDGIAMKAGTLDEQKTVFGRAQAAFDGKGVTLGTATLKDTSGKTTGTVKFGTIPVTIAIMRNPNDKSTKFNAPEWLQRVGKAIAEKEVSPIRIYLSMGITIISLIAAIAVLYSGVRNSVISIGRNPMGKKSIFRALLEIILTSLLILIIGLFAVYLLLKL
jgi:hypothetical protein